MPRLAIRSAVWVLTLLLRFAVTESKTCPEQNIRLLDLQEDGLAHSSSRSFWRQRPSRKNKSFESIGAEFPSEFLPLPATRNIDPEQGYKNVTVNSRTLMDYSGPDITEDLGETSDRDLASHVRVKRNEPVVRHRSNYLAKLVDSLPRNSWRRTNVTGAFGDSTFEGSRSDRKDRPGTDQGTGASRPRRKRGVLSKGGYRKKRVKGKAGHSRYRVETKHDAHQPAKKKTQKSGPSPREESKNTRDIGMPAGTVDESRVDKRESGNCDLKTDPANIEKVGDLISQKEKASLTNNTSLAEQQKENTLALPFVHTGRAQLRVRIEQFPANESSLISHDQRTDRFIETSPCSITLPRYNASDEILNVTNLELEPNFNSIGGRMADNFTVEMMLKKLDRSNASILETSDPENASSCNAESRPVKSNAPGIEDDRNTEDGNYDRTSETSAGSADEKSRAKRNQEIASERYLRSDKSARVPRPFEDAEQGTSIGDAKRGKTGYKRIRGNRAVRSIEEIKELAKKLIVKINKLQVYVTSRNEILHARDSCFGEDAGHVADEEKPSNSLEKDISNSASRIAKKVDNRQRLTKGVALAGKRASQMRSSGSRFARGEYRTRRRLRRKWGRWMDWSSCSVTCGKGRQIRWRHCLHDCNDAETEMEEKACQLPACPPGKFLGIF
ncbi:PREDICTED: uncharacterized protein LOC105569268 [Vollenhovia emeryi]|uniref:uncharacterized protein LOC105569268 n=1 Tax=Vollenhovia emeryi TaxID=411798 RepID=UPI0005F3750C|nr:PREDICTED: uncharacterized protein LOC105569268 [Vollenhovia emeryi]